MHTSPLLIERGMQQQLTRWHKEVTLPQRLGWKIGFNMAADQQRLGLPSAMIGFLSEAHRLTSGGRYHATPGANLLVEPEVALLIGRDLPAGATAAQANAAIAAYTAALELVDTTRSVNDDIEAILAGNLFHAEPLNRRAYRRNSPASSLPLRTSSRHTASCYAKATGSSPAPPPNRCRCRQGMKSFSTWDRWARSTWPSPESDEFHLLEAAPDCWSLGLSMKRSHTVVGRSGFQPR